MHRVVPYTAVVLLAGLALHYDMVLFARVCEIRSTGDYTPQQVLMLAVEVRIHGKEGGWCMHFLWVLHALFVLSSFVSVK
jgi:hypothetical protein